ncbi:MAG TPA: kelch repeat-containing protein, partial [Polyangiaceae bacterium]|nr:kelch repeat-containing protein [Polyangiaceae bacterium]
MTTRPERHAQSGGPRENCSARVVAWGRREQRLPEAGFAQHHGQDSSMHRGAVTRARWFGRGCLFTALALAAGLGCQPRPGARSASAGQGTAATEASGRAEREVSARFAGVLPRGLTTVAAATMGDALYLVGGYFGVPHEYSRDLQSGSVRRMQLSTGVWEELAGVEPVQSPALVGDGRYLYQLGGMRALNAAREPASLHSIDAVERFDPARNRWEPMPSLPEPRSSHQAVVVDGRLYVLGGWALDGGLADASWRDTMLVADLSQPTLRWNSVKVPFQVRSMGLVALRQGVYVLGGLSPTGPTSRVYRYDIATRKWADGPSLPEQSLTPRGAVHADRLIITTTSGGIYRLSEDELAWQRVGTLHFPRMFHEMVSSDRGPLVLAGIAENGRGGPLRVIERLSEEPAPAGVVLNLESATAA